MTSQKAYYVSSQVEACHAFVVFDMPDGSQRIQHGPNPEHSFVLSDRLYRVPTSELSSVVEWHRALVTREGTGECSPADTEVEINGRRLEGVRSVVIL